MDGWASVDAGESVGAPLERDNDNLATFADKSGIGGRRFERVAADNEQVADEAGRMGPGGVGEDNTVDYYSPDMGSNRST